MTPSTSHGTRHRLGMRVLLLLSALVWSGTPSSAQDTRNASPPQDPRVPIFGDVVDVRVVNVEVVVEDKDGIRVTGLQPADFRLLVDGQEVPIDYFTEVRGGEAIAAVAQLSDDQNAPKAVPALDSGSAVGTSYLVFVDDLLAHIHEVGYIATRMTDTATRQLDLMQPVILRAREFQSEAIYQEEGQR